MAGPITFPWLPTRCIVGFLLLSLGGSPLLGGQYSAIWQQSFGASSNDFLFALLPSPSGGYLAGGYSSSPPAETKSSPHWGSSDYWVVHLDQDGHPLWDRSYGGTQDDQLQSMTRTPEGFILGGTSLSSSNGNKTVPSFGLRDYWLVQCDSAGTPLWQKAFGGQGSDYLRNIHRTSQGELLVGGYSFSDQSGNKSVASHGLFDYWVLRLDASGNPLWQGAFGAGGNDYLTSLASTPNGGMVLAGYSYSGTGGNKSANSFGGSDFWIVHLDSNGSVLWDRSYGGSLNDYCEHIIALDDGGFLLGGYSYSPPGGNKQSPKLGLADYWIMKINADGDRVWETTLGGSGEDHAWALARDVQGHIWVGGWSDSPTHAQKSGQTFGLSDYWLAILDSQGMYLDDISLGGSQDEVILALHPLGQNRCLIGGYSFSDPEGSKTAANFGQSDYWVAEIGWEASPGTAKPILFVTHAQQLPGSNAGFRFALEGEPNETYVLEYSTNLITWVPWLTNYQSSPVTIITDESASIHPHRHYRARLLEK